MNLQDAVSFIQPVVHPASGTWADIGAGTGLFSHALLEILADGKVIAMDKSPHALYNLKYTSQVNFEILEADFNHPLSLPPLDGILMANALHYASDPDAVIHNIISSLKPDCPFILIEYNTNRPSPPWVPYPVPLSFFKTICAKCDLQPPQLIATRKSIYQDGDMYLATTRKK